jgi:hypothetical protein
MDIATCCAVEHLIRIYEWLREKIIFPMPRVDLLHHVMRDQGLAATIAP